MDDLIAKLEAATGPVRALDTAVLKALGTHVLERRGRDKKAWWYPIDGVGHRLNPDGWGFEYDAFPRYTASIDAALTLVPEGWTRDVDATAPECGIAVTLHGPNRREEIGDHDSEAIATVIAALKARS